jgi:hypothetical protein
MPDTAYAHFRIDSSLALDWGAGSGYARSATVLATSELRLLALPTLHLKRGIATNPIALDQFGRAVGDRS